MTTSNYVDPCVQLQPVIEMNLYWVLPGSLVSRIPDAVLALCREYAAAILSMDAASASQHTAELLQRLNFTSTFAFSKHLAEQLVDSTIMAGVSRAIVRSSVTAAVAQDPWPGYITGSAAAAVYSMGEWDLPSLDADMAHLSHLATCLVTPTQPT